jgi:hypothetical protein
MQYRCPRLRSDRLAVAGHHERAPFASVDKTDTPYAIASLSARQPCEPLTWTKTADEILDHTKPRQP